MALYPFPDKETFIKQVAAAEDEMRARGFDEQGVTEQIMFWMGIMTSDILEGDNEANYNEAMALLYDRSVHYEEGPNERTA